jgi:Flp pilus assembly protein TadB
MARRATLRAADADREHVAECLRNATAEGRLRPHELEERLEATFSARSYGELDAVVADLPSPPARPRRPAVGPWMVLATGLGLAVAIPLLLVILAAVLFVVLPVAATLAFWLGVCWWFLGHRRPARRRVYGGRGRLYITRF